MSLDLVIPSPAIIQESVNHLKDWCAKEPHLPNIEDERWIKVFLYQCKFSLEKAKVKIDGYYLLKNKYPNIMNNRDPFAPEILKAKEAMMLCTSQKRTKEGYRVFYCGFHPNTDLVSPTPFLKRIFMITDMVHLEPAWSFNSITIVDCKNFQYQHFLQLIPGIPAFAEILNKGYAERVKSLHLINAPIVIQKIVNLVRTKLPEKLFARIHLHSSDSDINLCEFVDENVLSCDYGGKGPTLTELDDSLQRMLEQCEPWFKEQDKLCSEDSLRKSNERRFELTGSFRKLEVD